MTTAVKSPVTSYAESVVGGKTVAGRLVRLACERHLRDLARADIRFDEAAAQKLIADRNYQALDQMVLDHLLGK